MLKDIDNWIAEKKKFNQEMSEAPTEQTGFGAVSENLLRIDAEDDDDADNPLFDSSDEELGDMVESVRSRDPSVRDLSKTRRVKFDEERNKTRTITPRGGSATFVPARVSERSPPDRPDSRLNSLLYKTHLRNIASRTDSGLRYQFTNKQIERKFRNRTSQKSELGNDNLQGRISPNKQQLIPCASVAVSYLDEDELENTADTRDAWKSDKRPGREVEGLSEVALSDSEGNRVAVGQKVQAKVETKGVDEISVCETRETVPKRDYHQRLLNEDKPKVLTKMTLELGKDSVIERKSVFVLSSPKPLQHQKNYVVPLENRPKSAVVDRRVKSAAPRSRPSVPPSTSAEKHVKVIRPSAALRSHVRVVVIVVMGDPPPSSLLGPGPEGSPSPEGGVPDHVTGITLSRDGGGSASQRILVLFLSFRTFTRCFGLYFLHLLLRLWSTPVAKKCNGSKLLSDLLFLFYRLSGRRNNIRLECGWGGCHCHCCCCHLCSHLSTSLPAWPRH